MAILPRKVPTPASMDQFIKAAPDAGAAPANAPTRTMKGKQAQISHAMPPELLEALDAFVASNPGLKRGPAINTAIRQMLERGITVELRPVDQGGGS